MFGLGITLLLLALSRLVWNHFCLGSIPGPLLASFSELWRSFARDSLSYGRRLTELHQKYGKLVRVGPNAISVSDSVVVCQFPGVNARGQMASLVDPYMRDQTPSRTAVMNRESTDLQPRLNSVRRYEGLIDQSICGLVAAIQRQRMLDMTTFFQFFATEFVNLTVLNDAMKASHNGDMPLPYNQDCTKTKTALPTMEYLLLQSPTAKLKRERCNDLTHTCREERVAISYVSTHIDTAVVSERSLVPKRHSGFDPGEVPIVEAGAASISKAFPTAFFLMTKYPSILSKLKDEIDTAFYHGDLSNPPQWRQTCKLQYLDAILKESMRYCPAIPFGLERVVPAGGIILEDRFIPEGTLLECHIEALRNDSTVYGEDVEAFRPERWLTTDTQRRRSMEQGLLEFNTGRRISSGVSVAWLELKKAAALMILNFDFQAVGNNDADIEPYHDLPPLMASFTPRVR